MRPNVTEIRKAKSLATPLVQGVLDVVGRAAVELAVAARQLVDLGERALDEACRAAEEGDGPHPEDGAGAARDDGNRDACDVADATREAVLTQKAWKELIASPSVFLPMPSVSRRSISGSRRSCTRCVESVK